MTAGTNTGTNAGKRYTFYGDSSRRPPDADCHPESPREAEPYLADAGLIEAVNLAIYLRRPLLLEGEAGCGKTRLASAIAYELGLPLYRWNIRSTSKAQEGQYTYDAMLRLHDVQAKQANVKLQGDPSDPKGYRKLGAIGQAFQLTDRPAVVLIDEIDKADLDFPNDLLTVLDQPWSFAIPETGETITATRGNEPIVIVTSNKEKGNLPAPFLRRCVYHYVQFPDDPQRLKEIVAQHDRHRDAQQTPKAPLVETACAKFIAVRRAGGLFKTPGTSEFLDWVEALQNFDFKPYAVSKLKKADQPLPYRDVLFKLRADWQKYGAS
jgi:MoxR-like ATPase